ncbi:hypothetical protein XENOCAPTIV_020463 [Xenoophorus captivus]|uniref:Ig-like domain-containing protein n=1 Tax=Xenoophorus captivus TaxID=1517983 RepID=A0ABV0RJK1_9TELE
MTTRCFLTGAWSEIKLEQSASEVKGPGETVKMSCVMSGFDMTEYYIHWIRQRAGRALEWIGYMDTGNNNPSYGSSFQSRFVMTEDVPSSTQFLEISSLTAEDSAVYFCVKSETLTQPVSLTVQSGQPLTLSCQVSYSVSSYWTAWIRHPAGKELEWIGGSGEGSGWSTYYKDSLKNKFSITFVSSSNTATLHGQNMRPEDSAVYYCAREPQ